MAMIERMGSGGRGAVKICLGGDGGGNGMWGGKERGLIGV